MAHLGQTICELTREHLKAGNLVVGQNLEGAQDLVHTVPVEEPGIIITPTTETAGCGFAVGMALSGTPTIHVVRFQSFLMYHSAPLVFYAAKAQEIWGYKIPLLVRAVASDSIGPTHSGSFISPLLNFPGLTIASPVTPSEYREVWKWFCNEKSPIIINEHRDTYGFTDDTLVETVHDDPDVTIVAVSYARYSAYQAAQEIIPVKCDLIPFMWLNRPGRMLSLLKTLCGSLSKTGKLIIVTSEIGIAQHLTTLIEDMRFSDVKLSFVTPARRSSGVASPLNNPTPTKDRVKQAVLEVLK